jgi:Flp pilus assembly protein TadD
MNEVVTPTGEPQIAAFESQVSPPGETTEGNGSGTHEHDSLSELEERSERTADPDEKIALWVQIGAEIERALPLGSEAERALSARMLRRTAAEWPGGAPRWLERVMKGPDEPRAKLEVLLSALREPGVDLGFADQLAKAAADTAPDRKSMIETLEVFGDVLERGLGASERAAVQFREASEHCAPDETGEALRLLERARRANPGDAAIELRLIELYAKTANFELLRHAVRRLAELRTDPAERAALLLSLEPAALAGSASEEFGSLVDELLPDLVSTDAPRARALSAAKARVLLAAKRLDEAASLYEELIETYAADEDVSAYISLLELGPTPEWRRDKRRWMFEWRAATTDDPVSVMIHWARVEEREFGDPAAAERTLARALEQAPARADALLALARLKFLAGDVDGGRELLTRLRGSEDTERAQAAELELARELSALPERAAIALDLAGSVLEHSPLDASARALTLELVRAPGLTARACELVEQSSAGAAPPERIAILGSLLEATESLAVPGASAELETRRRRWLDQVLAIEGSDAALAVIERAGSVLGVDPAAWQTVEQRALAQGDPSSAVRAYERALSVALEPATVDWLAQRLIAVVESHLSDPRALTTGLLRVLEVQPHARWAFDRVKLSLSLERRWDDLFPLYDRVIAAEKDERERALLLDEAAVAARDVASEPERAIRYWEAYLALRPEDGRVDVALERLYERLRKVERLTEHLQRREPVVSGAERARLRERIAGLKLESFDAQGALGVIEELLKDGPASDATLQLLERVLSLSPPDGAGPEALQSQRLAARRCARLLHDQYLGRSQPAEAARALSAELLLVTDQKERVPLLRELLALAEGFADARQCFDCLGQLLLLEPEVAEYRTRLASLADELGALAELAELEVQAADAAPDEELAARLLEDAARIELGLGHPERALELQSRILERSTLPRLKLEAAHALERLLAELKRSKERCAVLERIAELDPTPENRRLALLEGARVALDELEDPVRAAAAYRNLLEATPNDPALLDGWVRALAQTEQYSELVRALRARADAAELKGPAREDRAYAARLLADRLGQPEAAIDAWRAIRVEFGRDAESYEALSALLEARGRWQELCELIEEEVQSGRGHALLYARLAEVHAAHTGDLRAALSAYVRAEDLDRAADLFCNTPALLSDDPKFVLDLAGELVKKSKLLRAETVLRRQLAHYGPRRPKESASVHLGLSQVLCAAGRRDEALVELVSAAERHPSNAALLAALGSLSFESGDLDRAERSYQALLVLISHSPEAAQVSSRAELYLALGALSERRGEREKAEDQIEWAFEAALTSEAEAAALERGLAAGDRHPLLERAIRGRLERARDLGAKLSALSDLVAACVRSGHVTEELRESTRSLGRELERELLASPTFDHGACARLKAAYDALGEAELALALQEAELERATDEQRPGLELERARRLLAIPGRSASGVERLWSLLREERSCAEAAELLAAIPDSRERLDELVSVLDDHATMAAAEGRTSDAKAVRLRTARVLEQCGRLDDALHGYLALASEELYRLEALSRALSLQDELDAPAADVADTIAALLEIVGDAEVPELAERLIALAESLSDPEHLERGLERGFLADPTRADLRERLLALLEQRGDWLRVRDVLERAIASSAEPELVLRLADAHLQTGAPDRALDLLETVGSRVAPERAVRRRRAATLEAAGRTEEALEELLALNQAYGDASEEIGSAIRRTRIWADSERWALLAIETSINGGSESELAEIVNHWVERGAHGSALLWQLGELSSRAGDHARAARVYRRLSDIEQGEQRFTAVVALARAHEAAGESEPAVRALEIALLRAPESDELFRALYDLCGRLGDRGRQSRLLLERAAAAPAEARANLLLEAADTLSDAGDESGALEALSRLEALDPGPADTALLKVRVYRRLGRRDQALSQIQPLLEAEARPRPRSRLYRELAEIHLASDELGEAFRALVQAHQLDRTDLDTTWVLGVLAFDLDEIETAAAALRAFLTLREHGGERGAEARVAAAYCRLACIEHDRGQLPSARRLLALALQADPRHTEAQRLLSAFGAS